MVNLIIYLIAIYLINSFFIKKKIIKSNTGQSHQKFVNNSTPLTGGIFIFFPVLFLYFEDYPLFVFTYFLFFSLGLFSDLNVFSSAKKRFFIQIIVLLFFVLSSNLEISSTRIDVIDRLFENSSINYIFTIFCLIVLINGSNFVDGLNGLFGGYFVLILFFLYRLNLIPELQLDKQNEIFFIIVLLFLLIMNFSNKLFLGDSGTYSLSFLIGFSLIQIYNLNQNITPYFIILLCWYPCFENLFSIIRKSLSTKNPLDPDNQHLHHFMYLYLIKKYKVSSLKSNNLASLIINFFNLIIFYFASKQISHTFYQLSLLILSICFYILAYIALKKANSKN